MKLLYITSDSKKKPISNKFLNYKLLTKNFTHLILMISKEHKFEIDNEKNIIYLPKKVVVKANPLLVINPLFKKAKDEIEKYKPDAIHIIDDNSLFKLGKYFKKILNSTLLVSLDQINIKKNDYGVIDELIVNDGRYETILHKRLLNKYINTIEFGLDIKEFGLNADDVISCNNMRIQLKINNTSKIFLSNADKNLEIVIHGYKSFSLAHPECDSILVIMCGERPNPNIKELVKELQLDLKVRFMQNISHEEMIVLYKLSDIYLGVDTIYQNNVHYLYAMMSNTIVLANYNTSLFNIIKENESGFYFRDVDSFSETLYHIINLSDEDKLRIKLNAKSIASKCNKENYLNKMKKIYEKAIRNNW